MRELGLSGVVRGEGQAHDRARRERAQARRPRGPRLPGGRSPTDSGSRTSPYVRTWSGFAYVAFIIDACSPLHRRLAGLVLAPHRPRARRAGAGAVGAAGSLRRARPPQRSRGAVPLDPLYRAARGSPARSPRGEAAATLNDNALAESVIGFYKAELVETEGSVARARRPRVRDAGVGRLVQPPPPLQRDRLRAACRVRGEPLPWDRPGGGWDSMNGVSSKPGAVHRAIGALPSSRPEKRGSSRLG